MNHIDPGLIRWSRTGSGGGSMKSRNVIIPERLLFELYMKLVLKRTNVDDRYITDQLTKKFESNLRRMDYAAALEREKKV